MKYVAFLRGINVGGKNKIKMETLREVCGSLGFQNVKTYINSGNIVFETAKTDEDKLIAKIEDVIEKEFELKIRTTIRTLDEIAEIIANNPFIGQFEDHKRMHVFFLNEEMPSEQREMLLGENSANEQFAVRKREIYHLLGINFYESLGKDYVDKKLKIFATARNWRTVNKILEL